ncbi:hypothetical protein [Streptomyces sp. NPDC050560]|uniref:hypothetical protein n=1 Tax=Streptomyces sp. NPDC050560 TaxID=3365630 RepID=UPI0037916520
MPEREGREPGWLNSEFPVSICPGRQALAEALRDLCRVIIARGTMQYAREIAKAIFCNATSLSRHLSGQDRPIWETVEQLHHLAASGPGGAAALPVTLEELAALHENARRDTCGGGCSCMQSRLDAQQAEIECLKAALKETKLIAHSAGRGAQEPGAATPTTARGTRRELKRVRIRQQGAPGGLRSTATTPLPVQSREGDRQLNAAEAPPPVHHAEAPPGDVLAQPPDPVPRHVSELAEEMEKATADSALTADRLVGLLKQSVEGGTPAENAMLVRHLRYRQQDDLADELIRMCGRDQPAPTVVQLGNELYRLGVHHDAGALLDAATR